MVFVFGLMEIVDMIIMSLVVGFIFMGFLSRFRQQSWEEHYVKKNLFTKHFNVEDFKFAIIVTAPAILLHELGHKFVAMAFGLTAVFNAAYTWLALGVLMKFIGFIFFVPAYVSISAPIGMVVPDYIFSIVAFAGPGVNLIIWLLAIVAIRKNWFGEKYKSILFLTKWVNLLLFGFNMLPIPGFDGMQVYLGIFQSLF